MPEAIVFYSWQSDLPNKTNRTLIENALQQSVAAMKAHGSLTVEPVVRKDTQGLPGSPDIGQAIFDRIDSATAFVCDVSFVNQGDDRRRTPNPNVLVELGYALRALSWQRVVMVLNLATGAPEDLPFDLNRKRVLTYRSAEGDTDRAAARKELANNLANALSTILRHGTKPPPQPTPAQKARVAVEKGGARAAAAVDDYMALFAEQLSKANTKPQDAKLLVEAIETQTPNVLEFIALASEVASSGERPIALAMHRGFGSLLQQYAFPPRTGGHYRISDFDLPRFIGHELYTSFVALLLKRGHLGLLGELLREPLIIDANGNGMRSFSRLSQRAELLGEYFPGKMSPQGLLLKARHQGDSELAREMPFRLFTGADYLLYLHSSMVTPDADGVLPYAWVPWTYVYMFEERIPDWLVGARSQRRLDELCQAFGLSAEEFRRRYGDVFTRAIQLFPPGYPPLGDLPGPRALGSVP